MVKKAKKAAKTAKKKAVRKAAPKKAARKAAKKTAPAAKKSAKPVEKIEIYTLGQKAPGERYFILANGKPVQHVAHLAEILDDLEDHVFDHHVSPERNDFHNWVRERLDAVPPAPREMIRSQPWL